MGLAAPKSFSKDYFYRNSDSDEMLFIHIGSGKLRTMYGSIDFKYGDYLIIPKGTTYQIDFDTRITEFCLLNQQVLLQHLNVTEITTVNY